MPASLLTRAASPRDAPPGRTSIRLVAQPGAINPQEKQDRAGEKERDDSADIRHCQRQRMLTDEKRQQRLGNVVEFGGPAASVADRGAA